MVPTPLVARSKRWICDRSLAGRAGSIPARGLGCLYFVSVLEFSSSGRSLVQMNPTECGVSEWDRDALAL